MLYYAFLPTRDPDGSYFNEKILGEFAQANIDLIPEDFNKKLMDKVDTFKGVEDFPDDITVLTFRFFKENTKIESEKIEILTQNI
jgi:hypothetical protein